MDYKEGGQMCIEKAQVRNHHHHHHHFAQIHYLRCTGKRIRDQLALGSASKM
jgi:hypothetical protein